MEDMNQRAQRDLPVYHRLVNSLLDLANEMVENIQYSDDDHFSFMALCFLSKQIDHIRSILALNGSRDVGSIARTMIEGMCQLLWADKCPCCRALRWRTFAWVHDWRLMQAQITAGESVDATRRANIEESLRQHGNQFLTNKAKKTPNKGKSLPDDPYHANWTGLSVRQICDDVGGKDLYLKLYKSFSDWLHWSPGGLGNAIVRQGNRVVYSSVSPAELATAIATGFQCLFHTVEVVDKHFKIGMTTRIAKLKDEYITKLS